MLPILLLNIIIPWNIKAKYLVLSVYSGEEIELDRTVMARWIWQVGGREQLATGLDTLVLKSKVPRCAAWELHMTTEMNSEVHPISL